MPSPSQTKQEQIVRKPCAYRMQTADMPKSEILARDWMESHIRIMEFWLDRLIADGGDVDFITTLHRQSQWLGMMLDRRKD